MAKILESHESSSPIITRAVSNGLLKIPTDNYHFSTIEKLALRFIGNFPKETAEWLIPRVNSSKAFSQEDLIDLSASDLINTRLSDYDKNTGKFPAVTLGVGMGGATAHLSLALGGPFLPQAFVTTLKKGSMCGNVNDYFTITAKNAKRVTDQNPNLMSIQHYDPVHDGWLVKRVNHLRLKLIDLPEEYKKFILKKLIPGGDVVYLEGRAQWKRFRTGERNVFQIGGWGDISAEEFLFGSERLDQFAKREKLDFSHWMLDGYPLEDGPESEWGSEDGFVESLEQFCKENGLNFVKISYEDPNSFSKLAFYAKNAIIKKNDLEPAGVIVETFSQFDTQVVDQTALLPLWLIFNTLDSRRYLSTMINEFPKRKPVFFSGLSTFSNTPDIVPWTEWEKALSGFEIINIGARKSHYPADAKGLVDWKKPLNDWAMRNLQKLDNKISGNELLKLSIQYHLK